MTAAGQRIFPAFLRACRGVDTAATVLLLGAAVGIAANVPVSGSALRGMWVAASLFAGLIEKYFALRVKFDAELLGLVAGKALHLSALDRGLFRLFGRAAPAAGRGWEPRVRGAMALARRQVAAFAAQVLLLVAAAISSGGC